MAEGEINLREGIMASGKDAFIAQLHGERPLARDVNGFWVASRFEDVRAILLDYARFSSSAMSGGGGGQTGSMGVGFPLLTDDPPRHSMLRGLLAKAFTPAAMEAMRPAIEQLADDLAAAIPTGEETDIVEAMTTPLPVAVIAGMMGVPNERAMDFKRWSNAIMGIQDNPFEGERIRMLMELRSYFSQVAAERRAAPGDDLISALTRVGDATETLTDDQVVGFCILLMVAGNETTTNLLGNLLNRLAAAPDDWAAMRRDPGMIEAAIEESLRVDSPAQLLLRRANEDVVIGDETIKAGDRVLVYLASANRDPSRWTEPSNFELARERDRHVAFGHGVHTCIGAPLARMEAKAAMNALVARFNSVRHGAQPGLRLPGGGLLFGFRSLPVVLGSRRWARLALFGALLWGVAYAPVALAADPPPAQTALTASQLKKLDNLLADDGADQPVPTAIAARLGLAEHVIKQVGVADQRTGDLHAYARLRDGGVLFTFFDAAKTKLAYTYHLDPSFKVVGSVAMATSGGADIPDPDAGAKVELNYWAQVADAL